MADKFKFIRRGNKFAWENDTIRVEYSNPYIDCIGSTWSKCYDLKLLYSYQYNLKVCEKKYDGGRGIWSKLFAVRTGVEFDYAIEDLLKELNFFLQNPKPDSSWEKHRVDDKQWEYRLTKELWLCTDKYAITKRVRDKESSFEIYVGGAVEYWLAADNALGIYIPDLSISDLKQLKYCIKAFMAYTIENHNDNLRKQIATACNSYKYQNGKVYGYALKQNGTAVNYEIVEEMIVVGTEISSVDVIHFKGEHFYAETFTRCKVVEITQEEIAFNTGVRIPLNRMVYIFTEPSKEMLAYNVEQITEDFLSILNDVERAKFAKLSEDTLYIRYGKAIVERTWMFREEHGFVTPTQEDRRERIHDLVKKIIREIKERV